MVLLYHNKANYFKQYQKNTLKVCFLFSICYFFKVKTLATKDPIPKTALTIIAPQTA